MQIANPLYDTVFAYMLNDEQVAKLFLSALLQREIVELYYNPEEILRENEAFVERTENFKKLTFFSVLRLDFAAKILDTDGKYETVLIELQKASNGSDLMRFRKYLGLQYTNKNNSIRTESGKIVAIPLLPIYFLGEGMNDIKGHGAVKIERVVRDMFTGEIIDVKDDFIENLSHDSIVVCANELQGEAKTGLQKLLSIFNLASSLKYEHLLIIDENNYPEEYRPIIRRLQKAAETPTVRRYMDAEDDLSDYFISVERERDKERELKIEALAESEKNKKAKLKADEQKKKEIEQRKKAEAETKKAEAQTKKEVIQRGKAETQAKQEAAQRKQAEADTKKEAAQRKKAEAQAKQAEAQAKQAEAQANSMLFTLVRIGIAEKLTAEAIAEKYSLPLANVQEAITKL